MDKNFNTTVHHGDYYRATRYMRGPARCLYLALMVEASQGQGRIPVEPTDALATALGFGLEELQVLWPQATSAGFERDPEDPGHLRHQGVLDNLAYRDRQRIKGERGAVVRAARKGAGNE